MRRCMRKASHRRLKSQAKIRDPVSEAYWTRQYRLFMSSARTVRSRGLGTKHCNGGSCLASHPSDLSDARCYGPTQHVWEMLPTPVFSYDQNPNQILLGASDTDTNTYIIVLPSLILCRSIRVTLDSRFLRVAGLPFLQVNQGEARGQICGPTVHQRRA